MIVHPDTSVLMGIEEDNVIVDDVAYSMHFDGWKCYYRLSKPSEEDLLKYTIVDLTCPITYEPQRRRNSRCIASPVGSTTDEWRARMGYPTLKVMESTLQNSTNMVTILQSETRDYMRDHHKLVFGLYVLSKSMMCAILILSSLP